MTQTGYKRGLKAARLQKIVQLIVTLAAPFAIGRQLGLIQLSLEFSAAVTIAILAGLPLWLLMQVMIRRDPSGHPTLDPALSWIPDTRWFAYVLIAATLWGAAVYVFALPLSFAFLLGMPMGYLAATAAHWHRTTRHR